MASGAFIINENNSKKKVPFGNGLKNKEEGGKPDQPNNPPSFPPPQPNQKESPIQERVKQFLAEGSWSVLLKTNPNLTLLPDNYIGELLEKGYNDGSDMRKLFDWKLNASDIPDLNSTQRVGVIKGLTILVNKEEEKNNPFFPLFQEQKGNCHELVVVARKTASDSQNDPTINIDGRIWNEVEETYFREIITSVLAQETNNPNNWEVSILYANAGGPFEGKSGGTALYLALLSAIYKKPLPNNLAATGEIAIKDNKILAVGGLKGKITAAFNQGVRKLVLPQDNSTPNGTNLENFFLEIYQQQVPPEIREKMTVHWTGNCQELKDLVCQNIVN